MKPISLVAAICLSGLTQAASAQTSSTEQDANKAVVRAYLDGISNKAQFDSIDSFFAPDVVFNGSRSIRQQIKRMEAIRKAFPDHRLVIEDQIAEGDCVVTRVTFHGTHKGEFQGIAPTGRRVEYSGIAIDRLENRKVVEMWHLSNGQDLVRQLTTAPPKPATDAH